MASDCDIDVASIDFHVPGHGRYDLSVLVPIYGVETVGLLASALKKVMLGLKPTTAANYFGPFRRFLLQGGLDENPEYVGNRLFRLLKKNDLQAVTAFDVEQALFGCFDRLRDYDDYSFTTSTNDKTRAGFWDGIKRLTGLLAGVAYFPPFRIAGTIPHAPGTRTPVFADLSREAGRLKPSISWVEAEEAAVKENIELLDQLREALEKEFAVELACFLDGQRIVSDNSLPTANEIDQIIRNEGVSSPALGSKGSRRRFELGVKLLYAVTYDDYTCASSAYRYQHFIVSAGGQSKLRSYLGATPKALHAAFVIVLIDTGWNLQPCADLGRDPFVGEVNRGRRRIKSIGSVKNRANDLKITGVIADDDLLEAELSTKRQDGRLSGVKVIEQWIAMTLPLRQKADRDDNPAANSLWIWRERYDGVASSNCGSIDKCWWYDFLARLSNHPRLGGLSITHRSIRKTFLNIEASKGVLNVRVAMALADHASDKQTHQYLTEATIHAVYSSKMRKFMELWESTSALGIEDAARWLGVTDHDLKKMQQLGLSSGFDFAILGKTEQNVGECAAAVTRRARTLVANDRSFEILHLARLALKRLSDRLQSANPSRWVRSWLTYQVIIDGYCGLLQRGRYRVQFERAVERAERRVASKDDALPLLI